MTDEAFEVSIRQILRGDKDGLRQLYEEYNAMIYSTVYEILNNPQNTEDVVSEYFIKLWKVADLYQFGGHHRAWMLTIARNMALDYLRKYKREVFFEEMEQTKEPSSPSHEEETVRNMSLTQALAGLEKEEREIINLKIMGQLTFKEIAKLLQRPMGTVAWKYKEAIGKLKRCGYE